MNKLTDEKIQSIWDEACHDTPQKPGWCRHIRYARAIESEVLSGASGAEGAPELLEWLGDKVSEGSVLLKVETDMYGDPSRYRIGVKALGEDRHSEYLGADFSKTLEAAMEGRDALPDDDKRLDLWEWDEPDSEEVAAIVACLGDDAAQLREVNDEDERATNMDDAADMIQRLEKANRHLFTLGQRMHAELESLRAAAPAAPVPAADATNEWLGDMMILQVLADSENVNEQEREVLKRWMARSEVPAATTPPADGGMEPFHIYHPLRHQNGEACPKCSTDAAALPPAGEPVAPERQRIAKLRSALWAIETNMDAAEVLRQTAHEALEQDDAR